MQHLPDQTAPRALAEAMAPAFDAVESMAQPSDAALAAIGEQVDALAAACALWRAWAMR